MANVPVYYYMKLRDTYFKGDCIEILESMENGYLYSYILLKLSARACRFDGQLKMTDEIPYTIDNVAQLSKAIHHDISHVQDVIRICSDLGLIFITEDKEIFLTEIQSFIGKAGTEAERKRRYREQLKKRKSKQIAADPICCDNNKKNVEQIKIDGKILFKYTANAINEFKNKWNEYGLPEYRRLPDNMPKLGECIDQMKYYSPTEIIKSFENYKAIAESVNHKLTPEYNSFEGFLRNGIEKYVDGAKPFDRCCCKKNKSPIVEFDEQEHIGFY